MNFLLLRRAQCHRLFHTNSISFCGKLIDHCLILTKPTNCAKAIHAGLIKIGLNFNTFLGNRCTDMYGKVGTFSDALKAFDEISEKNVYSWNICLKLMAEVGNIGRACQLFDEMPERDVVSWNTMISAYMSCGFLEKALDLFVQMQQNGVRPTGFTFSILVSSSKCASVGKEIHCNMIRNGVDSSNVVVWNSLIDMYGKIGLVEYAVGVFWSMEGVDIISWNSLISGCCNGGEDELALELFCFMRSCGYPPDEFTMSTTFSACSNLHNLEEGKQILCLCVKMGFLSNTIVSSAAIDYLSKCNRIEDSVHIFRESSVKDSALCDSMISTYARHGFEEEAVELFVIALRENIRPTEVTLSSVLSCVSYYLSLELGSQVLCLVLKSGFGSEFIVANSVVDMYLKVGLVDYAFEIFANMVVKDLIAWNTMIIGLTHNGEVRQSIALFKELIWNGLKPDKITFSGVLLACCYGRFLEEGMAIFSSMEEYYGVPPTEEHYAIVFDMIIRAGKLEEALCFLKAMPHFPNAKMWESIMCACRTYGDEKLVELVAERMVELNIESSLAYSVLAEVYENRGRWESLVRIRRLMKQNGDLVGSSWIKIGRSTLAFGANPILHHCGKDAAYSLLRLLIQEVLDEANLHDYFYEGAT